MKTLGNKQNIRISLIIALVSIFSLSSVMAQKSVKNFFRKETKRVDVAEKPAPKADFAIIVYDNYAKSLDFVIEEQIEIENWMTNPDDWSVVKEKTNTPCVTNQDELVNENEVQLETWMFNFDIQDNATIISEQELALEDWMVTADSWQL